MEEELETVMLKQRELYENRIEELLDKDLNAMGVRPLTCHFREGIGPFAGITVALDKRIVQLERAKTILSFIEYVRRLDARKDKSPSDPPHILKTLRMYHISGVSVCDECDSFSERNGRIRAKNRLLDDLREKSARSGPTVVAVIRELSVTPDEKQTKPYEEALMDIDPDALIPVCQRYDEVMEKVSGNKFLGLKFYRFYKEEIRKATLKSEKNLLEELAALEHEQWVEWSKAIDRTEAISPARYKRWIKLWCPYSELTEEVKEHDRMLARKVLKVINNR